MPTMGNELLAGGAGAFARAKFAGFCGWCPALAFFFMTMY